MKKRRIYRECRRITAIAILLAGAAVLLPLAMFTGCPTDADNSLAVINRDINWVVSPQIAGTAEEAFTAVAGTPVAASVAHGATYKFKAAAILGDYTLSLVTVDTVPLTADSSDVFAHTIKSNVTITAVYTWDGPAYDLIFDKNADDQSISGMPENQFGIPGQEIERPDPNPTRANYTFDDWYTEAVGGEVVSFPFMLEEDTAIYAQWLDYPVVTFVINGVIDNTVPVAKGTPVGKPTDPETRTLTAEQMKTIATGVAGLYQLSAPFLNWFDEDGAAWNFDNPVDGDLTLTAKWDHLRTTPVDDLGSLLARVSDKPEAFLALMSGNSYAWFYGDDANLKNADLTILAAGDDEIKITFGDKGGSLFWLRNSHLTIGKNITIQGIDNYRVLVVMDSDDGFVDKTKFTMLPGSKLIGNKNAKEWEARAAGIELKAGTLVVDGAEISGNDCWLTQSSEEWWNTGGINFMTQEWKHGKIIVSGDSIIKNNIMQNATVGPFDAAVKIRGGKGKGALTLSGSADIGICHMDNSGSPATAIEVAGPWTGNITLDWINKDNPVVYGAGAYTLTASDLNHITLPDGYLWGPITGNSASVFELAALTAGPGVNAASDDTSANVTFTGAAGLTLAAGDFTVSAGGIISGVSVTDDTATITINFASNSGGSANKTYTVGINPASTKIKGSASVTVTQSYPGAESVNVTFMANGETFSVVPVFKGSPVIKPAVDPAAKTVSVEEMVTLADGVAGLYALSAAFDTWYDAGDNEWNFANPVNTAMTLTAKWKDHFQFGQIEDVRNHDALMIAVNSRINDSNEAFLLLLGGDIWFQSARGNLSNTELTIFTVSDSETLLMPSGAGGSLFSLYDAKLTIGNNITLTGMAGNWSTLVILDGSDAASADDLKTRFTMLPGSKLINNKNGNSGGWDYCAGIRISQGVLIVNGAEISGNDLNGVHTFQAGGIDLIETGQKGKIIIQGESTILNNMWNGIDLAMRVGDGKGIGALTLSGSAQIGYCRVNTDSAVGVAGPWTGNISLLFHDDDYGAPLVYGVDGHSLTKTDLDNINLPAGFHWGAITGNAASAVAD